MPCAQERRRRSHCLFWAPVVLALVCVAGAVSPGVSLADESFPALGEVDDLAAHGGYVVWERSSAQGQRLTGRWGGVTRDLRVPAAARFAGTDLGRDARGRFVVVYSRCNRTKHSCDIYLYRFSSGRESRVNGVSKRGCNEFEPSISRGVIAFGRGSRGRGRQTRCKGGLYVKGRRRRSKARRLTRTVPAAACRARTTHRSRKAHRRLTVYT